MKRYLLPFCVPMLWIACQPIIIGVPREPGDAGAGGEGGSPLPISEGGAAAGETSGGQAGAVVEECTTERNLKLSGRLTTPLGEPVVHGEVRLSGSTLARTSVFTDEDGNYAFEGLCAGRYRLNGCLSNEMQVSVDADRVQDLSGTPGSCDRGALKPNVLLLTYDPAIARAGGELKRTSTVLKVGNPPELADELVDFLLGASGGHVQATVASVQDLPGFPPREDDATYTAEQYADCIDENLNCLPASDLDVDAIANEQALCDAVWQHGLDEIWLLRAPRLGQVPLRSLTCTHPETAFVKQVDVVGLDFEQGIFGLLADYHARSHQALAAAFSAPSGADGNPYASFSQVAAETSAGEVSGCGEPDHAPNSQMERRFDDLSEAPSFCDAFFDYPALGNLDALTKPISCEAWGCTERGFRRYWFAHLPRARWLDESGRLNDFWRLIGRPAERAGVAKPNAEGNAEPICSSSYKPGWCTYVDDGEYTKCNDNEWATKEQSTGFAEWFYAPQRLVTSITLYDRRCAEQVKNGHIEFSDGSPDLTFGPLDNGEDPDWVGKPTTLSFEPKLLSGLRVVIDKSTGGNPGFAEISIASTDP